MRLCRESCTGPGGSLFDFSVLFACQNDGALEISHHEHIHGDRKHCRVPQLFAGVAKSA
jgi:hypothetical protein